MKAVACHFQGPEVTVHNSNSIDCASLVLSAHTLLILFLLMGREDNVVFGKNLFGSKKLNRKKLDFENYLLRFLSQVT